MQDQTEEDGGTGQPVGDSARPGIADSADSGAGQRDGSIDKLKIRSGHGIALGACVFAE
jgi:hypothetical protein